MLMIESGSGTDLTKEAGIGTLLSTFRGAASNALNASKRFMGMGGAVTSMNPAITRIYSPSMLNRGGTYVFKTKQMSEPLRQAIAPFMQYARKGAGGQPTLSIRSLMQHNPNIRSMIQEEYARMATVPGADTSKLFTPGAAQRPQFNPAPVRYPRPDVARPPFNWRAGIEENTPEMPGWTNLPEDPRAPKPRQPRQARQPKPAQPAPAAPKPASNPESGAAPYMVDFLQNNPTWDINNLNKASAVGFGAYMMKEALGRLPGAPRPTMPGGYMPKPTSPVMTGAAGPRPNIGGGGTPRRPSTPGGMHRGGTPTKPPSTGGGARRPPTTMPGTAPTPAGGPGRKDEFALQPIPPATPQPRATTGPLPAPATAPEQPPTANEGGLSPFSPSLSMLGAGLLGSYLSYEDQKDRDMGIPGAVAGFMAAAPLGLAAHYGARMALGGMPKA